MDACCSIQSILLILSIWLLGPALGLCALARNLYAFGPSVGRRW
jgi:hypothetical protein